MNEEIIDLERWGRLLKHPDFKSFEKHIEAKLASHRKELESKYAKPSADRSYEVTDLLARIDELKKLFSRINFKKHEYRQFEKEKQLNDRRK